MAYVPHDVAKAFRKERSFHPSNSIPVKEGNSEGFFMSSRSVHVPPRVWRIQAEIHISSPPCCQYTSKLNMCNQR